VKGLLVAGTTSDAGKSLVTAAACRLLARQGLRVAPFKSQNMSNNSMVCADGAEIGRAQWLQAVAAGAEPEAAMNPVLLKPGSDRRSHIVLMGRPAGTLEAGEFATGRRHLAEAAFAAFEDLSSRYDLVVAEGAGSPAEVNLRGGDYVNMGLAREFGLPVVVVGDIDRGGVLAAMYGTLGLLSPEDRALVRGWIVNKFRGSLELLQPGLRTLEERTGRPVLGVLPWLTDVWLDSEDALALNGMARGGWSSEHGALRVAAVRFPRISNATDIDALAAEPGVDVTFTDRAGDIADADLVVLPGSRATLSDLAWLRSRGLDRVLAARVASGRPVLGICGGNQMLARTISDPAGVEGGGEAEGLGHLPTTVTFGTEKLLGRPTGSWRGQPVTAYEIHHGVTTLAPGADAEAFLDGFSAGVVWGTTWHGAFENDGFRRAFLGTVATAAGSSWVPAPDAPAYSARREAMLDRLADALDEAVGAEALLSVAEVAGYAPRGGEVRRSRGQDSHGSRGGVVTVVGLGAEGYAGLPPASRAALDAAGVVLGGKRQLDLLPDSVTAERVAWPSPLRPAVRGLVDEHGPRGLVVLASGDPMLHGIGRTLVEELGAARVRVLPQPSSVSLACARMGWPVESTPVLSTLTSPVATVLRYAGDGARLLVLSRDADTPREVADLLCAQGFGASVLTVLGSLGSDEESRLDLPADHLAGRHTSGSSEQPDRMTLAGLPALNVVAVSCVGPAARAETPGLPDDAYDSDGQLTKREVRAVTVAALGPRPGELLWDVGGGSGSVAIEWLRAHPSCRAVSVERDAVRAERIEANAARLGVPSLTVVRGAAPAALAGLPAPDVIFVGGGLTAEGVFEACWAALHPGGRLVANAVTLESQAMVTRLHAEHGGELVKIDVARSTPVGGFTGWRPAMPVVQWMVER
jgi:adenosylcobyric acid synthase